MLPGFAIPGLRRTARYPWIGIPASELSGYVLESDMYDFFRWAAAYQALSAAASAGKSMNEEGIGLWVDTKSTKGRKHIGTAMEFAGCLRCLS